MNKLPWYKSQTVWSMIGVSCFGVIDQALPLLQENLGSYYGYVFMAVGFVGVILRASSTKPIGK